MQNNAKMGKKVPILCYSVPVCEAKTWFISTMTYIMKVS